jgi:hypothetical protein
LTLVFWLATWALANPSDKQKRTEAVSADPIVRCIILPPEAAKAFSDLAIVALSNRAGLLRTGTRRRPLVQNLVAVEKLTHRKVVEKTLQ